ncbi:hypothetical protein D3C72_1847150 [compost metagenome]
MVARREHQVDIRRRQLPLWQHAAQRPAAQVLGHVPFGPYQQPLSVERPRQRRFAVVGAHGAAHLDGFLLGAVAQVPGAEGLVGLANEDAVMPRQLARA